MPVSKVMRWMFFLSLVMLITPALILVRLVLFPPNGSFSIRADAVVLLAGEPGNRLPEVVRIYREGLAERVVLTNDGVLGGWSTIYNRNLYQIEWVAEALVKSGVPRESIVHLPFYGSSTVYDALAVRHYAGEKQWKRITLVTSDYHAWRALWTFRKVFEPSSDILSVATTRSNSINLKGHILETIKICYYLVKYGVFGLFPEIDKPLLDLQDSRRFG